MSDSDQLPPPTETMHFVQPADFVAHKTVTISAGTTLGHYVIKKHIGGGGMGQVYLASDEALDRDVAIKVLTPQRSGDQGTVARFMNEARSAARLNHEHIAQVYFAGESRGIPFIAFEYVEGINIRTMVEEHDVFSLPQALNYLLQIAHALAHAATHNVVHRDVKPSNILITREGRAKLIDMGLARLLDTVEGRDDLTASGVTLGTFDYISPEQARDPRNADIRSDIYSLGCTFFFMLAGRPPFPEGTVLQKLLQHQGDVPPDIRSFQPTIPADVALLIQRMMAKDPRQRFQTPTVLIDALTDVARRLGLRPAGQGTLVWTYHRSHRASFLIRHLPWVSAVSLLLFSFFLMTIFSRQFYKQPPLPESLEPSAPILENPLSPSELTKETVLPFAVTFFSHPVVHPTQPFTGLRVPRNGGSLRPTLKGTGSFRSSINGKISVADLKPASFPVAVQRSNLRSSARCVDPTGNTAGSYPTLASALVDVKDGTTIELKWNQVHRIQEPIWLDKRKLQFVAAAGYNPILLFESSETQNAQNFFTISSSNIQFQHVGLEIRLNPNILSSHWSLFDLSGNTQLAFEKCCLTIRNISSYDYSAYHEDVVLFRNDIPIDLEGTNDTKDLFDETLTIHLTDSLLRGEAIAIQSNVPQDIRVECTNSLIALAKPFLQVVESRRGGRQASVKIRWDGVMFFGRQGVANLIKETTVEHMCVDFESYRSIFVLNRSHFATFRGISSPQMALENFQWSGMENYFQGVSGLRFRNLSSLPDSGLSQEISLAEWQDLWASDVKTQTRINSLTLNEISKPMFRYLPRDVRLFDPADRVLPPDFNWFPSQWND